MIQIEVLHGYNSLEMLLLAQPSSLAPPAAGIELPYLVVVGAARD